ncbi:glycosyltransferase [Achromobacter xylosoxidans]|nr:glycosyltransferase [Achromobacter xylosoxidans]
MTLSETASKPRVAHISSAHQRNDIRIFVKECSSLARAGYDVRLYVGDGKGEAMADGVNIHDVGASAPGRFRRMIIKPWKIWLALRRNKEKVVHFHDPELIPITLLLHWAGISVVYDAHEDVPRQILSKPWLPNGTRRAIAGLFEAV